MAFSILFIRVYRLTRFINASESATRTFDAESVNTYSEEDRSDILCRLGSGSKKIRIEHPIDCLTTANACAMTRSVATVFVIWKRNFAFGLFQESANEDPKVKGKDQACSLTGGMPVRQITSHHLNHH